MALKGPQQPASGLLEQLEARVRQQSLLATDEVVRTVLPHLVSSKVKEVAPQTYTVKDLRAKYKICDQTVRNWRRWGWLPPCLPTPGRCRKLLWDRQAVDEHIARLRATAGEAPTIAQAQSRFGGSPGAS